MRHTILRTCTAVLGSALALAAGCVSAPPQRAAGEAAASVHQQYLGRQASESGGRHELPELAEPSRLPDYLAYAALNNPGLEAAFSRWKAALERVPQVTALPDPRFNYRYFIREVETRVGPQRQAFGVAQAFPWFGKLDLAGGVATEAARAAQARYEAQKLALFHRVKDAYYEYYYLARAIAVVRDNAPNADGRLKPGMFIKALVRSQVAAGGRVMDARLAGKWMCPMHPDVVKDAAAACDICEMPLVRTESLGYVSVDPDKADKPLVVPASAALVTGKRAVVYVEAPGRDRPTYEGREVALGPRAGDYYLVRDGLAEGERVVVKGNFKIDSALQIQARPSMMSPEGGAAPPAHPQGDRPPPADEAEGSRRHE